MKAKHRANHGFTIVELLIVIVVIAILASISIVAFTGVQNRARTVRAQSNAASVQKIAEAYYAENGVYPTRLAHFNTTTARLPADVNIFADDDTMALDENSGENYVLYLYETSDGDPNSPAIGACAIYWDFNNGYLDASIAMGSIEPWICGPNEYAPTS